MPRQTSPRPADDNAKESQIDSFAISDLEQKTVALKAITVPQTSPLASFGHICESVGGLDSRDQQSHTGPSDRPGIHRLEHGLGGESASVVSIDQNRGYESGWPNVAVAERNMKINTAKMPSRFRCLPSPTGMRPPDRWYETKSGRRMPAAFFARRSRNQRQNLCATEALVTTRSRSNTARRSRNQNQDQTLKRRGSRGSRGFLGCNVGQPFVGLRARP